MSTLDSHQAKLLEIMETGMELLMTRGALTTANDVATYFALLPAVERLVMPRRHRAIDCLLAGLLPAGRTLYDFFTVPTAFSPIFPWAASEIRTFGTPVPRACRSRMRHRPDRAKGRSANLIQIGVPVKLLLRWRGKWQVRTMVSSGH